MLTVFTTFRLVSGGAPKFLLSNLRLNPHYDRHSAHRQCLTRPFAQVHCCWYDFYIPHLDDRDCRVARPALARGSFHMESPSPSLCARYSREVEEHSIDSGALVTCVYEASGVEEARCSPRVIKFREGPTDPIKGAVSSSRHTLH